MTDEWPARRSRVPRRLRRAWRCVIACPQSPDSPGLRVLIVEADSDVREGIREVVDLHPDVGLAWGTETVGDAIRTAALTHPDVVLVHDFRVAAALRVHVAADGGARVMILTGHDHRQHVDRSGDVVEVDGGTLGAGGVFAVGHAAAGFAQVHLTADGWPSAVDLISADPITGDATARRIVLDQTQ